MKLKIGTGTSGTTKKKKAKKDDYFSDFSDEELEDMSDEANSVDNLNPNDPDHLKLLKKDEVEDDDSIEDVIKTQIEETVQDEVDNISKETEDVEEAVNGVFILDEVGIKSKYATKYATLFPKKRVVYRDYFTKAFLKWYITNADISQIKDLFIIESEYVKPEQKEEVMKWITKRMKKPLTDDDKIEVPDVLEEPMAFELTNEIDAQMYEFLLSEKWDKKERAKGIIELDGILVEQMRVQDIILTDALKYLIDAFHIQTKWDNLGKENDSIEEQMVIEAKIEKESKKAEKYFESVEPYKGSNAEVGRELDRSIKRFHHIKFLYDLMGSDKMELVGDLSDEEFKHIQAIDHLLNDREELEVVAEKRKITTKSKKHIPFVDFSGVVGN